MSQTPQPDNVRKSAEQRAFEQLNKIAEKQTGSRWADRLFAPLFRSFATDSRQWEKDSHLALQLQRLPRARVLLYAVVLTFVALVTWASLATVDEITRGEGKVIPSRQLQIVQSVDGGVLEEIHVQEGDSVTRGQLLARIDPTRFLANEQEQGARIFSLEAKIHRLQALIDDLPFDLPSGPGLTADQHNQILQEQRFYNESKQEQAQRMAIANQQLRQKEQELQEARARLSSASSSLSIASQELERTRPLLASGAVSEVEVLRLQRDVSGARGERDQASARVRQMEAAVVEANRRVQETGHSARNRWRGELTEANSQLASLEKSLHGLTDRVKFAEIRSPVDGTVQRVLYNTVGGVVQPSNAVLEVVPADDTLVVEAKILPKDIAFLRPQLPAMIKFHAYDFSIYGGMQARLQHISADSITDERDNTYYLIRVVSDDGDADQRMSIIPGMTAQVDILTGKKTIMAYIMKPLLRAKANALSER